MDVAGRCGFHLRVVANVGIHMGGCSQIVNFGISFPIFSIPAEDDPEKVALSPLNTSGMTRLPLLVM